MNHLMITYMFNLLVETIKLMKIDVLTSGKEKFTCWIKNVDYHRVKHIYQLVNINSFFHKGTFINKAMNFDF